MSSGCCLSFHYVGPREGSQVDRLGSGHIHLLSHLTGLPFNF